MISSTIPGSPASLNLNPLDVISHHSLSLSSDETYECMKRLFIMSNLHAVITSWLNASQTDRFSAILDRSAEFECRML